MSAIDNCYYMQRIYLTADVNTPITHMVRLRPTAQIDIKFPDPLRVRKIKFVAYAMGSTRLSWLSFWGYNHTELWIYLNGEKCSTFFSKDQDDSNPTFDESGILEFGKGIILDQITIPYLYISGQINTTFLTGTLSGKILLQVWFEPFAGFIKNENYERLEKP